MSYCIFNINGGIGKAIAATAVCKAIKAKYPEKKLIVVSGYPDVFLNNPHVYRAFGIHQLSYFYSEYIEGKNSEIFAHDPYMESSFLNGKKHLIQIWCEMFGIPYNGEQPEIFLTDREVQFHKTKFQSEKPLLVMQTNGGGEGQALKYSWARDIPAQVVVKVVNHFADKYTIAHIRRQDQFGYEKTVPVSDDFRSIVTLISISKKRLLMDSFAQHTAAALNLPSVVLWIANSPSAFGYKLHENIIANDFTKEPELKGSYLQKFDITGNPTQFPYNNEEEIFNVDRVIAALEGASAEGGKKPSAKNNSGKLKKIKP